MANTLTNFLVGIGFDFDTKGAKQVDSSIDSVRRSALQAGSAIAGAFGVKRLTNDFADATNQLSRFSQVFGYVPNDIAAMGRAVELQGGSLNGLMSQLEGIERLQARMQMGDFSFIPEGMLAGADADAIANAKDGVEAYRLLIQQMEGMTKEQRLNVADVFGLDEATIRIAQDGSDAFESMIQKQKEMRPVTQEMIEQSKEFDRQWRGMWTRLGAVTDKASMQILPAVNNITAGMNNWYDANEDIIDQRVDEVFGLVADHLGEIAVIGGGAAMASFFSGFAGLAKSIPMVGAGLGGVAGALSKLGQAVAVAGVAYVVSDVIDDALRAVIPNYDQMDQALTEKIYDILGIEYEKGAPVDMRIESRKPENDFIPTDDLVPRATVITPKDIEKATKPRAQSTAGDTYGYQAPQRTTQQTYPQAPQRPIQVQLMMDSRVIKEIVVDVNDEQSRQTLRDIKSPYRG